MVLNVGPQQWWIDQYGPPQRSVRFNSADSAYLSRTPASAGNRKTWTWAGWVKRSALSGSDQFLFLCSTANTSPTTSWLSFNASEKLSFGISGLSRLVTTQVLRDASAWYHVILAVDTTQATASNRYKLYLNGTQITAFDTADYVAQNTDTQINAASEHRVGRDFGSFTSYLNGYLADIHFIDGQALDPTSFGFFDDNDIWQHKAYTGSYGTNGFHLPFSDNSTAAALGTDTSGNGNDWTVNNISATTGGPTSVASASGALPIYNTTDTYGTTKGTGTRTDTNSSSIVLALPMDGANNGTTFTDESATIKGSGSPVSITRNLAVTKTDTSKFYGSSAYFGGESGDAYAGAYLQFGTQIIPSTSADFTIEMWVYLPSPWVGTYGSLLLTQGTTNNSGRFSVLINTSRQIAIQIGGTAFTSTSSFPLQTWAHLAWVRSSGTIYLAVNGVIENKGTLTTSPQATTTHFGSSPGWVTDTDFHGYVQDLRVYSGVAKYTGNFNPPTSTQIPTVAAGNDSLVDIPTNGIETDTGVGGEVRGNYATLNPLNSLPGTLANGNLDVSGTIGVSASTIGVSSGKWYCEVTLGSIVTNSFIGFGDTVNTGAFSNNYILYGINGYGIAVSGYSYLSSLSGTGSTGDIIGIALDCDAGTFQLYKNGVSLGSVTGFTITNPVFIGCRTNASVSTPWVWNFGQRPFAYTAPSGFKALCTANLPAPVVTKPSTLMDVKLYTGNGSTQTISGLGFSPDFVWYKERSAAINHLLFDQIRGARAYLISNATNAEATAPTHTLTAFNSDGFSVSDLSDGSWGSNGTNKTYVAWTWDAGSSTVTNTDGSITSSVRANPSAGFSIVTWTGTGGNGSTVGHGLGVAPAFIVIKQRIAGPGTDLYNWNSYHSALGATKYIALNKTDAESTAPLFNDTAPTSTVFSLGSSTGAWNTVNDASGVTYVAYCFAPVDGYSSFGSYTGNGSADGPFVYTGFRPRWILVKATSIGTENWILWDSARNAYNASSNFLRVNKSDAEGTTIPVDILSNGFKLRYNGGTNQSGVSYIYAAFSEAPFQYARAR